MARRFSNLLIRASKASIFRSCSSIKYIGPASNRAISASNRASSAPIPACADSNRACLAAKAELCTSRSVTESALAAGKTAASIRAKKDFFMVYLYDS
nr:MAG TPA: hypothetical protein [Inoviridae sp.]